ncbi:hypothetical protein BB561_001283 [Smittium simulii]|uniref:Vta1 C-terminal domain-containing protein n=1 Tax=Smittium simulii TaxID=133385 RepID=A0A2T9YVF1_9FUNG|nr:hypothetical protein BB561_001283 [Smittium simulii]
MLGLQLNSSEAAAQTFLSDMLDQLEQTKARLVESGVIKGIEADMPEYLNFCLKVFAKADNQDRDSPPTKLTAMNFVAASQFMQASDIFGEKPQHAKKVEYAKWRATEILKSLKTVPNSNLEPENIYKPGSHTDTQNPPLIPDFDTQNPPLIPGLDPQIQPTSTSINPNNELHNPTLASSAHNIQQTQQNSGFNHDMVTRNFPVQTSIDFRSDTNINTQLDVPAMQSESAFDTVGHQLPLTSISIDQVKAAQKHAKWAISALDYEDTATAIDNLQNALDILKPYHTNQSR